MPANLSNLISNGYKISFLLVFLSCGISKKWQKLGAITESLHDIEVFENTCWSYSYGTGNLYQSKNGGSDWQRIHQFDSLYFEQIQFTDDRHGWIVGSPNQIYRTMDGGHTWDAVKIEEELANPNIYAMYFRNNDEGFIAPFDNKGTRLYYTENGGSNWQIIDTIDNAIFYLTENDGSLYGSGYFTIFKDLQSGNSAQIIYQDTSRKVGQIRTFDFTPDGFIVAASFSGYIIQFSDGNWTQNQITKNRLRWIEYLNNSKTWIAVGDQDKVPGNIFESRDARNWTMTDTIYSDVHRLYQTSDRVYLAGKDGFLARRKN